MESIDRRLETLGITLPEAPEPLANYVSVQKTDNLLFLSGAGPILKGKALYTGKLGQEITLEDGQEAARLAGINLIASLKRYLGDLDRVDQIVKLLGFVASKDTFYQQPAVIDGCSNLFADVFGERGRHARSAVAVPVLPLNIPVEIEIIVRIK